MRDVETPRAGHHARTTRRTRGCTPTYHGPGLGRLRETPDRMMDAMRVLPTLLLAAACGSEDPILERAAEMEGRSTPPGAAAPAPVAGVAPAAAGTPEPPAPGRGTPPQVGRPGEPAPGDPGHPAPGRPKAPEPGSPGSDGPSVVLSGTVSVEAWAGGPIRLDIFDGDQLAAAGSARRPSVVAQARVDQPGPFEVRVPVAASRVWVGGFADENRNGRPDPRDPSGWFDGNPVATDADRGDLVLKLRAAPPPGGGVEME